MKLQIKGRVKQYRVDWTGEEKYERVYLRIKNITPIKNVESGRLMLSHEEIIPLPVQIDKTMQPCWQDMPELGNATYCFELYGNKEGKGNALEEKKDYVGSTQDLKIRSLPYGGGFVTLEISCRYEIPRELFWLSFKEESIGGQFFLPPMERKEDHFVTSCLIRERNYDRLTTVLDKGVEDYLVVKKIVQGSDF